MIAGINWLLSSLEEDERKAEEARKAAEDYAGECNRAYNDFRTRAASRYPPCISGTLPSCASGTYALGETR